MASFLAVASTLLRRHGLAVDAGAAALESAVAVDGRAEEDRGCGRRRWRPAEGEGGARPRHASKVASRRGVLEAADGRDGLARLMRADEPH